MPNCDKHDTVRRIYKEQLPDRGRLRANSDEIGKAADAAVFAAAVEINQRAFRNSGELHPTGATYSWAQSCANLNNDYLSGLRIHPRIQEFGSTTLEIRCMWPSQRIFRRCSHLSCQRCLCRKLGRRRFDRSDADFNNSISKRIHQEMLSLISNSFYYSSNLITQSCYKE